MVRKSVATRLHHGESLTSDASLASHEPGADGRRGRAGPSCPGTVAASAQTALPASGLSTCLALRRLWVLKGVGVRAPRT